MELKDKLHFVGKPNMVVTDKRANRIVEIARFDENGDLFTTDAMLASVLVKKQIPYKKAKKKQAPKVDADKVFE